MSVETEMISLPSSTRAIVDRQMATGLYATEEELITRALLNLEDAAHSFQGPPEERELPLTSEIRAWAMASIAECEADPERAYTDAEVDVLLADESMKRAIMEAW